MAAVESVFIPLEHFMSLRQACKDGGSLSQLASDMLLQYKCFTETDNMRPHTSKKFSSSRPPRAPCDTRCRIGGRVLSKEAIARKEVLMYANKLAGANKKQLIQGFKPLLRRECIDIYTAIMWDLFLRAPEYKEIYADFLFEAIFESDNNVACMKLDKIMTNYINDKAWYPSEGQDEDYSDFCDSVKWRKRAVAAVEAFIVFASRKWLSQESVDTLKASIAQDLENVLQNSTGCKISDALLDQLAKFDYVDLSMYNIEKLRPATKFKILDIMHKSL